MPFTVSGYIRPPISSLVMPIDRTCCHVLRGVGLSHAELVSIAGLVLAAGFETTVNLLSNGINLLCQHREQLDALRAEPSGWPNAVD